MNTRAALLLAAACVLARETRADTLVVPDVFPSIQSAVDFADEGDEILVRAGLYTEAVLIDGKSSLVVRGQGKAVIRPGAGNVGLQVQNGSDVVVRDLFVERAVVGILFNNVVGAQVLACTVSKCDVTGISLSNLGGDVVVADCRVKDGFSTGIDIAGFDPADISITDNEVDGLGSGIVLGHYPLARITGNEIRTVDLGLNGNNGAGVWVFSTEAEAGDMLIEGNRCEGGRGVLILDSSGITVTGNELRNCVAEGILVRNGDGIALQGNKVTVARKVGIDVDFNSSDVLVDGNVVRKALDAGVRLSGAGATCTGNTLSKSGFDGLILQGDDGTCSGNLIGGSGRVGLVLGQNATGNTLSLNLVKGSKVFDFLDDSNGSNIVEDDNQFGTTAP